MSIIDKTDMKRGAWAREYHTDTPKLLPEIDPTGHPQSPRAMAKAQSSTWGI